jgi:acetyltransferase-like isoleucine patch superfamily enzyme
MIFLGYISSFFRNIYTGYFSKGFKKFGKNSVVKYPSFVVGENYISIGEIVSLGKRICLTAWKKEVKDLPFISIGDNTDIGDDCHITAINKIIIGNNVLLGKKITITDNSHGSCDNYEELLVHPSRRNVSSKGGVVIEDNVWIGDKVSIMGGVTLGKGVVIGANSVVTKSIPRYSIAVGIPAKVIKTHNNK